MLRVIVNEEQAELVRFAKQESDPARIVAARLRRSGYLDLCRVQCVAHDGVVQLTGTVPSFHIKQIAQELAIHTPGVSQVVNCLRVVAESRSDADGE
jgi:osmotically-inducible protein OsmY